MAKSTKKRSNHKVGQKRVSKERATQGIKNYELLNNLSI